MLLFYFFLVKLDYNGTLLFFTEKSSKACLKYIKQFWLFSETILFWSVWYFRHLIQIISKVKTLNQTFQHQQSSKKVWIRRFLFNLICSQTSKMKLFKIQFLFPIVYKTFQTNIITLMFSNSLSTLLIHEHFFVEKKIPHSSNKFSGKVSHNPYLLHFVNFFVNQSEMNYWFIIR